MQGAIGLHHAVGGVECQPGGGPLRGAVFPQQLQRQPVRGTIDLQAGPVRPQAVGAGVVGELRGRDADTREGRLAQLQVVLGRAPFWWTL